MAWSISITAEGWQEIRNELETWSKIRLINALCDDRLEEVLSQAHCGLAHAELASKALRRVLERYVDHDSLVDAAYNLVEQNNTCDNGGWAYWVDREGYHKVLLSNTNS